jgi:hypothetical protein
MAVAPVWAVPVPARVEGVMVSPRRDAAPAGRWPPLIREVVTADMEFSYRFDAAST